MTVLMTFIVPAAHAPAARNAAECVAPTGAGMWTTPLSATGVEPASHYISSGHVAPEFAALTNDPALLFQAAQAGAAAQGIALNYTQQQMADAMAASDVSMDQPFDAMARMGLQLVEVL